MTLVTRGLRWLRWIVLAVLTLYLIMMFVGTAIYLFIDPDISSIELIKTVFELSLWLAVPVCVFLLVLRSWRIAMISIVLVLIFAYVYLPYLIPRSPEFDADAPQLTVMTFNLKMSSEGIVDIVRSADADIVAFQELSQEAAEALSELEDIYPYQALHPQIIDYVGQGVISRYPIEDDVYWEYFNVPFTLGHQRLEIDVDGTLIAFYNTHPWPPLEWESGYDDESHSVVVQDIAERTFAEELPLILVGDFNMTDNFEEYELLDSRFTDSYRDAGGGMGYTYPSEDSNPLPALLRLDYIWHNDYFQSVESQVWDESGQSDHAPVITILALTANR